MDGWKLKHLKHTDVLILPQDEEKILMVVEESQNKLLELNNQLLLKKSQVADAKAEMDQKIRSTQEINKYLYCYKKKKTITVLLFCC